MTNVFGRTMVASQSANGRQHNQRHHVTVMIGPAIKGSVIGGPTLAQGAAGGGGEGLPSTRPSRSTPSTGLGAASGDIAYGDTLSRWRRRWPPRVGLPSSTISQNILSGTVVPVALVS